MWSLTKYLRLLAILLLIVTATNQTENEDFEILEVTEIVTVEDTEDPETTQDSTTTPTTNPATSPESTTSSTTSSDSTTSSTTDAGFTTSAPSPDLTTTTETTTTSALSPDSTTSTETTTSAPSPDSTTSTETTTSAPSPDSTTSTETTTSALSPDSTTSTETTISTETTTSAPSSDSTTSATTLSSESTTTNDETASEGENTASTSSSTIPATSPVTPPWQQYLTRINIQNITEEEFNNTKDELFREAVAKYTTDYCNSGIQCQNTYSIAFAAEANVTTEPTTTNLTFTKDDVVIERRDVVGSDLQIGYYVAMQDDQKLQKDVLDQVMVEYQEEIETDVGISFDVVEEVVTESPKPDVTEEPGPSGGDSGLEPWAISLIALASFLVACAIAGVIYKVHNNKKKQANIGAMEMQAGKSDLEYKSLTSSHRASPNDYDAVGNRQSIASDTAGAGHSSFNSPVYENTAFEMQDESSSRR